MFDLVGNPADSFSRDEAHIITSIQGQSINALVHKYMYTR